MQNKNTILNNKVCLLKIQSKIIIMIFLLNNYYEQNIFYFTEVMGFNTRARQKLLLKK